MKALKYILGGVIIAAGVGYAIYLGVWVMLVGGIIQIINAVQAQPIVGADIAWGVVKILFCEMAALIAYAAIIIGGALMNIPIKRIRRINR